MKKINILFTLLAAFLICGCADKTEQSSDLENNPVTELSVTTGALGSFNLLTPTKAASVVETPTFTWEASANAATYTLEISTVDTFPNNVASIPYIKETNISAMSYKLTAPLKLKNTIYYWRVTAVNPFNKGTATEKLCEEVFSFMYESPSVGEIGIELGELEDWNIHQAGSQPVVSMDKSDFFGTGNQNSLVISFDKEHMKQGIPSSDGWLCLTRFLEQDFYGTDSLYFNFYYSGNDANAVVRLIDTDGEYWYKDVLISQNSKQTILIKFSDFVLRTKDTLVQNEIFDYEHIQSLEIVFEKAFGDGCCVVGGFKAVNFETYKNMFISKFDFNSFRDDQWVDDTYKYQKTVSEDGYEMTLSYSTAAGFNGNEKGIGSYGYGFKKIAMNCYLATGNAIKLKIKYNGYKDNNSKIYLRVYEEDTDRWSYEQPMKSLVPDQYSELTIPYCTFAKSQTTGDGNRQFSYLLNIQFGAGGIYGNGSVSFKDVEVVTIPSVYTNPRSVGIDGVIDNFDSYTYRTQLYETWEQSVDNKDEGIFIDNTNKFFNGVNVNAAKFTYKSDMGMAAYDTYTNVSYMDGNAISFYVKDASRKSDATLLKYLDAEDVAAKMTIQLALKDGRWYRYTIDKLPKVWTEYTVSFDDFYLEQGIETDVSEPFVSQNVINFAVGFQYFYYLENSLVGYPVYVESNEVYMDEIMFKVASSTESNPLDVEIHPEPGTKVTKLDDFEYASNDVLNSYWLGINGYDYENITLSNDVSSEGGNHSMKLDYKGQTSPSYARYPSVGKDVKARAIILDIKGDGSATMYINFYITKGSTLVQFRCTLANVAAGWHRYTIGLGSANFANLTNSDVMNDTSVQNIQRLTFGLVGNNTEVSSVYVDNIKFDSTSTISFSTKNITALA